MKARVATKFFKQTIKHYTGSGKDIYGDWSTISSISIAGLWLDKSEKFNNSNMEEELSNAIVYTASSVSVGDRLSLGSSSLIADSFEVRRVDEIPDYAGSIPVRKVWL